MKKFMMLGCLLLSVFVTGCASTRLNSKLGPGQTFDNLGKTYVAHFTPDKRNLHEIIASDLTSMGNPATAGEREAMPADTQTLVTYKDKWMWDMSNYMLQLNIEFRDPKTDKVIVSGESFRTSLVRKDPPFMIHETLEKILEKKGQR